MKPQRTRGSRATLAWLLSLLLILSPLLAQAHAHARHPAQASAANSGGMPCHRMAHEAARKPVCPHCNQSGRSLQCDCCDHALSQSLPSEPAIRVGLVLLLGQTVSFTPRTRPEPPPAPHYRPPIAA